MATVLVTGGTGFLGSQLVRHLLRRGDQVRILARNPGRVDVPEGRVEVYRGDVRDAAAVAPAVSGASIVIHTASNFRHAGSDGQARAINVDGSLNVCQAAIDAGTRQLIHCSTIGVHGSVRETPATEDTPFNPGDLYQATKLEAEHAVRALAHSAGLPTTIVRPISIFGPGDTRMLKLFRLIKTGRFVMLGDGSPLFQPAYIDDVVRGFLACIDNPRAYGDVFIVGGEEYLSLADLVALIADELGVPRPRRRLPLRPVLALARLCELACAPFGIDPPLHRRRVGFFRNDRAFRLDKAREVLGFRSAVSLREGVRRTIRGYEAQGWL